MTLAANGQMSAGGNVVTRSINLELGRAWNFPNSALGSAAFRTLAGVPSGAIRLGADFYGKTNFVVAYSDGFPNDGFYEYVFGISEAGGVGLRWNVNGTIDLFTFSAGYTSLFESWGSPTIAGIGSNYWIRFTRTATNGFGAAAASTPSTGYLQLNSAANISIEKSPVATVMSATYTIEIASDSAGANVLSTRTGIILSLTDGVN